MLIAFKRLLRRSVGKPARRLVERVVAPALPPSRAPDPADPDPIGSAVDRGTATGGLGEAPFPVVNAASRFFSGNAPSRAPDEALAQILGFVEAYPGDERLQVLAGRMLERSSLQGSASRCWTGVSDRFPGSAIAFARRVGRMSRERGAEAAHSWLLTRFPALPADEAGLLVYAAGFSQINEFELADEAHEALLRVAPREEEGYLIYAKSLERRGEHDLASRILEQGVSALGERPRRVDALQTRLSERSRKIARAFPELPQGRAAHRDVLALFLAQARQDRIEAAANAERLGKILLIGGSLGAGGAERQFVATALRLQAAATEGTSVGGRTVEGPVGVLCQSLTSREGADFFLPTLKSAGISVAQMTALPSERGREPGSCAAPYLRFLDYLPHRVADGVLRLSDEIRARAPDVVHIWQDGMVLTAASAALIAGVPRIVLSARTMPPIVRLGRKKPEYETLYRGLLDRPGVAMTANSARAANRYAEWLGLPPERIGVVHNGARRLPEEAGEATAALAQAFDERTAPSSFTLGCVMRFDENKRPGPWLDVAQRVLAAVPDARFVLVGDGPLWESTKQRAQELGLAERVLFPGRSPDVGYWLSRMSVFLLLSHIEGLPNALIEAQLAGVPVVTTPAGGAAESILPGVTGEVLPSEDNVDPDAVAAMLVGLAHDPERCRAMSLAAADWAERTFSVESMIEATVAVYAG